MTGNVSRCPSDRASGDHLPQSAKQVKVRIERFQGPGVKDLVESRQTLAANFDTSRCNVGPGADKGYNENDSEESS